MSQPHTDDDLYRLLGIHAAASFEEIRRAYRKSAMTWHPDRNVSADAEETFKRIRSAYEILRDSKRRADYDRHAAARAERVHHAARHRSPPNNPSPHRGARPT